MESFPIQPVTDDERDSELAEAWTRTIDDPKARSVHGVEAARWRGHVAWPWQVGVWVMEFVRDVPLEAELRRRIAEALRAVPGVTEAKAGDREMWIIKGSPTGKDLVAAVAAVVDELADQARACLE